MAECTVGHNMFVQKLRYIGSEATEETEILAVHSAGLHQWHR